MVEFTSVLGSDFRATTDTTCTVTIIRMDIIDRTITGRTTGITDIGIIAMINPIISGASLIGIATPGWLEAISSQPNFFRGNSLSRAARYQAVYFPDFGEAIGLAGLLPGSSIWNSFLSC